MKRSLEYCRGCEYLMFDTAENLRQRLVDDCLFCAAVTFSVEDPASPWNTERERVMRGMRRADHMPRAVLTRHAREFEQVEFSPSLCMRDEHVTLRRLREL